MDRVRENISKESELILKMHKIRALVFGCGSDLNPSQHQSVCYEILPRFVSLRYVSFQ